MDGGIFVTAVEGDDKSTLIVARHDLEDGEAAWRRRLVASRRLPDADTTSKAAPTPVVDARHVYALFESGDLVALTHAGVEAWRRSLMDEYGEIQNRHHYGSSPLLVGDTLVVLVSHAGPSYLLGVDIASGRTRVLLHDRRPHRGDPAER